MKVPMIDQLYTALGSNSINFFLRRLDKQTDNMSRKSCRISPSAAKRMPRTLSATAQHLTALTGMLLKLSLLLRSTKNREALPNLLTFNPNTRTFQGTIPGLRNLEIKLTATDTSGATASDVILMKLSKYGAVIDGYISGATLFLDANKNGVLDIGEPSTTTDSNGEYNLDIPF